MQKKNFPKKFRTKVSLKNSGQNFPSAVGYRIPIHARLDKKRTIRLTAVRETGVFLANICAQFMLLSLLKPLGLSAALLVLKGLIKLNL